MLTWHTADPRSSAWYSGWALSGGIPEHRTVSLVHRFMGVSPTKKTNLRGFTAALLSQNTGTMGGGVSRSSGMGAEESVNNPAWYNLRIHKPKLQCPCTCVHIRLSVCAFKIPSVWTELGRAVID